MRKNVSKVVEAFKVGKAIKGDSKGTIHTDGHNIYSYNMLIAKHFDNGGKPMYVIISDEYSPSVTTTKHIRQIQSELPHHIVRKDSILTWDFKFNSSY